MRYENNSGFGRQEDKKQNFRYTMIAIVCVCIVAVGAIFTVRANPQWIGRNDDSGIDLNQDLARNPADPELDVVKPVPTVDSKNNPQSKGSDGAEKPGANIGSAAGGAFQLPVENATLGAVYSKDTPIYSKTLDQYVVHEGVDLLAPADTQVKAAAEGTITKVYTDDKLGTTIEITHGNGLVTRYGNLSTEKMVEEGDVVKKGDPISGVGNTALFESLDPPHLHFEVLKDGSPVDPSGYVTLPQ